MSDTGAVVAVGGVDGAMLICGECLSRVNRLTLCHDTDRLHLRCLHPHLLLLLLPCRACFNSMCQFARLAGCSIAWHACLVFVCCSVIKIATHFARGFHEVFLKSSEIAWTWVLKKSCLQFVNVLLRNQVVEWNQYFISVLFPSVYIRI